MPAKSFSRGYEAPKFHPITAVVPKLWPPSATARSGRRPTGRSRNRPARRKASRATGGHTGRDAILALLELAGATRHQGETGVRRETVSGSTGPVGQMRPKRSPGSIRRPPDSPDGSVDDGPNAAKRSPARGQNRPKVPGHFRAGGSLPRSIARRSVRETRRGLSLQRIWQDLVEDTATRRATSR